MPLPTARGSPLPSSRFQAPHRLLGVRSIVRAIAMVSVAAALSGCAGWSELSPTSTAHQQRPEPQIPLSCDEVPMGDVTLELAGEAFTLWPAPTGDPFLQALKEQGGRLDCEWTDGGVFTAESTIWRHAEVRTRELGFDDAFYIDDEYAELVVRAPLAAADRGTSGCSSNSDETWCRTAVQVGDYLVSLSVTFGEPQLTEDALQASAARWEEFATAVVVTLTDRPLPRPWAPRDVAWPRIMSCELFAGIDLGDVATGRWDGPHDRSGFDPPPDDNFGTAREVAALDGSSECIWAPTDAEFSYPSGGGWIWARFLADGGWYFDLPDWPAREAIDVPGGDEAWLVCPTVSPGPDDARCQIHVRVGVNALRVDGGAWPTFAGDRADLVAVASRIVGELR